VILNHTIISYDNRRDDSRFGKEMDESIERVPANLKTKIRRLDYQMNLGI
jgi:hypothetical protein